MSWTERSLDELGTVSRGRSRNRPRDAAHLFGGEFPFVQTGDVKHSGLYLTNYSNTYSEAGLAQSRLWPEGTLCITIAANIADTSILKIEACFPDSVIGFVPEKGKADVRFIKYLFDATLKKKYKTFTQGAAQDNLSQGKLLSIKFPVPDITVQEEIANLLSKYDDLIENNKRRIELLEESARHLYKEWFVRFRFPGHEHVKIIDGVPEGWVNKSIGELGEVKGGKRLPKGAELLDIVTRHPYLRVTDMSNRGLDFSQVLYINEETHLKIRNYVISSSDIYISIAGTIGRVGFVPKQFDNANLTENAAKICFTDSPYLRTFILFYLKSDVGQSKISSQTGGTSQPKLAIYKIRNLGLTIPTNTLLVQFHELASNILKQIECLQLESSKLENARDLLLPKLMNGELAV